MMSETMEEAAGKLTWATLATRWFTRSRSGRITEITSFQFADGRASRSEIVMRDRLLNRTNEPTNPWNYRRGAESLSIRQPSGPFVQSGFRYALQEPPPRLRRW